IPEWLLGRRPQIFRGRSPRKAAHKRPRLWWHFLRRRGLAGRPELRLLRLGQPLVFPDHAELPRAVKSKGLFSWCLVFEVWPKPCRGSRNRWTTNQPAEAATDRRKTREQKKPKQFFWSGAKNLSQRVFLHFRRVEFKLMSLACFP